LSTDIVILHEDLITDRKDPKKPVQLYYITFQMPDLRIRTIKVPADGYNEAKRNAAIREFIAKGAPDQRKTVRV